MQCSCQSNNPIQVFMPAYLYRSIIAVLLLLLYIPSHSRAQQLPELDSVDMLLTNIAIQIECTQGINDMYNFKFKRAESQFMWLRRKYPSHPLPYFLMGLSQWWKIAPNIDNEKYDQIFLAYMDSSIMMAEKLLSQPNKNRKIEAAFFLAGAYGFKGRLYSERKNWSKATFAGKKALKYMEIASDQSELSPELLFGDGLYNYYSVWVPENYPILKPVLLFFKKGEKAKGIQQLEKVVSEAFYTKTEAQYFLMRIYSDENQPDKAFETSRYLHQTFPDNPYFHRYFARMLYSQGDMYMLEPVAKSIMARIDSGQVGYEEISGRYASFYLGHLYRVIHRDIEKAKHYYLRTVDFAERSKATDSGYYLYALAELARQADKEGNIDLALQYQQKIHDNADRKHPLQAKAKEYIKKNKKRKK
jgi:hypothetical protein